MSQSIKVNYIFSLINTLAGILFPLITFPYASRIMEADGIGQVGFFTSLIGYISLFTSLGIPIYAIREIAKTRDNNIQMSKTAIEILLLHSSLVVIGYIIVALMCLFVDKVSIDIPLFLILSLTIFFNAIGCEWFYQGIEEFKYIAVRGLIVRLLYVIFLFSFVHTKSDILVYAGLTVFGTVGNNIFNFWRLWKYVKPQLILFKELQISRHIAPAFRIFALNLVISLYVNLDAVMLGFLKDSSAVGYYEGSSKIARLVISIIQSLQTAMIPRFSYLAKKNDLSDFYMLIQKVVDYVFTVSVPMSVGLAVMSPTLIHLFCGPSYEPAIITLEIISPIVFMISISGIICFQILYPLGKETLAIWSTATGAVINLILCFLLIPTLSQNGAAIAVLAGETTVALSMYLFGKKYVRIKNFSNHYLNTIIGSFIMLCALLFVRRLELGDWLNLFIMPILGLLIYGIYLYIRKDTFGIYILETVKNKINRK